MNWYYARGDERMGPVDEAQIVALASTGQITAQTLVWREGMADWMPWGRAPRPAEAEAILEGAAYGASISDSLGYVPCTDCGRTFLADEMVAYEGYHICADCKPVFFQRIREGDSYRGALRYAGFWIRFAARLLDGIILGIVGIPLNILQSSMLGQPMFSMETPEFDGRYAAIVAIFSVLSVVIAVVYESYFIGRFAATPGKMVLGLRVVRGDGSPVSYKRAIGRYFAIWLNYFTLLIGFVMAAFDGQKRALHDHICDTRVVHK